MMNTMKTSIKRPRFASSPLPMMVMGWIAGASSLACAQGLAAAGLAEPPGWRIAGSGRGRIGLVGWCERGDSNPHARRRSILSRLRLPFHHSRDAG